jgi:competence CoiA-like predicted nuclease
MQTNSVTAHQKPVFYVQAVFYKDQSWYRKDMPMTAAILNHEQKHFDLCEVYARQLRKNFRMANLNAQNLTKEANRIFNEVNNHYLERQTMYDKETRHGQDDKVQTRWNTMIAEELVALEEFCK